MPPARMGRSGGSSSSLPWYLQDSSDSDDDGDDDDDIIITRYSGPLDFGDGDGNKVHGVVEEGGVSGTKGKGLPGNTSDKKCHSASSLDSGYECDASVFVGGGSGETKNSTMSKITNEVTADYVNSFSINSFCSMSLFAVGISTLLLLFFVPACGSWKNTLLKFMLKPLKSLVLLISKERAPENASTSPIDHLEKSTTSRKRRKNKKKKNKKTKSQEPQLCDKTVIKTDPEVITSQIDAAASDADLLHSSSFDSFENKPSDDSHNKSAAKSPSIPASFPSTNFSSPNLKQTEENQTLLPIVELQQQQTAMISSQNMPSPNISLVARTPTTTKAYAAHVEIVASVVASTGLDRKSSLHLANETILRRLESDFSAMHLREMEMSKADAEEKRRVLDQQETERRHKEIIEVMHSDSGLPDKVEEALNDLRKTATKIFPGIYFCVCVMVALLSGILERYWFVLYYHKNVENESKGLIEILVEQLCGCREGTSVTENYETSDSYYSTLSYALPRVIYDYATMPSSSFDFIISAKCYGICSLKFIFYVTLLFGSHRLLGIFHCHEMLHHAINLTALIIIVLPSVTGQSSSNANGVDILLNIARPIAFMNVSILLGTLVYLRVCYREGWDEGKNSWTDEFRSRIISRLKWTKWSTISLSIISAIYVGVYVT